MTKYLGHSYEIGDFPLSNSYAVSSGTFAATSLRCEYRQEHGRGKVGESPSRGPSFVIIGRNSRGYWVAQENTGLFGGLFVSRAQAFKYARSEKGHHHGAIVLTTNVVELDMHRKTPSP